MGSFMGNAFQENHVQIIVLFIRNYVLYTRVVSSFPRYTQLKMYFHVDIFLNLVLAILSLLLAKRYFNSFKEPCVIELLTNLVITFHVSISI